MSLHKQKKNQIAKENRLLISIAVLGSAGPIRFIVNEDELVAAVIQTALKCYARQGRLPVLGSDLKNFILYCPNTGLEALSSWERIGSQGTRDFMLCKKPEPAVAITDDRRRRLEAKTARKASVSLISWINKSLNLKIHSH